MIECGRMMKTAVYSTYSHSLIYLHIYKFILIFNYYDYFISTMGIRHAFCLDIMGIRWFSGHSDGILSLCVFCGSVKVETDHGITFCPRLVHHPRQEHLWGRQADNCQSLRASVGRRQFLNADRWYRCMFNEFQWSIRHQTLFVFIGNNKIFVHTDPRGLPGLLGFDGMCGFGMGNFLLILKCPFDLWTNPCFPQSPAMPKAWF